MTADEVLTTSNDYSSYCDIKLSNKLKPIDDFTKQLFVRLEELQVLLDVANMNKTFPGSISTFLSFKNEFEGLCYKIDRMEALMLHLQSNLDELEEDIIKTENELGFGESTIKVPNLFTPLFRKVDKKEKTFGHSKPLNTKDYFTEIGPE